MKKNIDINKTGTIILGPKVVADGYEKGYPYRIQTHVHHDHLVDFGLSLGRSKKIFISESTLDLYSVIRKDPTVHFRKNVGGNVKIINQNQTYENDQFEISFLDSSHILGSIQCSVEYKNGLKVGYSGDFSWPLEEVIEVDELVIDSTYGSPNATRDYSQDDAQNYLIELIQKNKSINPIIIMGHRGTIHRMMQLVSNHYPKLPILLNKRYLNEVKIFNKYHYSINKYIDIFSNEGIYIKNTLKEYIQFLTPFDALPTYPTDFTFIHLSGFLSRNGIFYEQDRKNEYTISITDHADHNGIIEFVEKSGAKFVLTDPTRSNYENAIKLAKSITQRLGVKSEPAIINY